MNLIILDSYIDLLESAKRLTYSWKLSVLVKCVQNVSLCEPIIALREHKRLVNTCSLLLFKRIVTLLGYLKLKIDASTLQGKKKKKSTNRKAVY